MHGSERDMHRDIDTHLIRCELFISGVIAIRNAISDQRMHNTMYVRWRLVKEGSTVQCVDMEFLRRRNSSTKIS